MIVSFKIYEKILELNDNFYHWFGDSKVTKDGQPMVLYHGTKEKFDTFDVKKIGWGSGNLGHYGYGFYFSDDIREAQVYGNNIFKCYVKIEKPFTGTDEEMLLLKKNGVSNIDDMVILSIDYDSLYNEIKIHDPKAALLLNLIKQHGEEKGWDLFVKDYRSDIKDYYNDLTNGVSDYTTDDKQDKKVIGFQEGDTTEIPSHFFKLLHKDIGVDLSKLIYNRGFKYSQALHWITDLGNYSRYVTEIMIKLGYDGVIYGSEYVVFDPKNIKSIDNDGSWDVDDSNIYS